MQRAADVVHVGRVAVVRPVDRRDRPELRRPAHRELHGVEAAPGDAGDPDAAGAPVLLGEPRRARLPGPRAPSSCTRRPARPPTSPSRAGRAARTRSPRPRWARRCPGRASGSRRPCGTARRRRWRATARRPARPAARRRRTARSRRGSRAAGAGCGGRDGAWARCYRPPRAAHAEGARPAPAVPGRRARPRSPSSRPLAERARGDGDRGRCGLRGGPRRPRLRGGGRARPQRARARRRAAGRARRAAAGRRRAALRRRQPLRAGARPDRRPGPRRRRPGRHRAGARRRAAARRRGGARRRQRGARADRGHLALPLLRGQPAARVRPGGELRAAPRPAGRRVRALRAGRAADGLAGADRRPARGLGFAGLVDGPLDAPGAREAALERARACGYRGA